MKQKMILWLSYLIDSTIFFLVLPKRLIPVLKSISSYTDAGLKISLNVCGHIKMSMLNSVGGVGSAGSWVVFAGVVYEILY